MAVVKQQVLNWLYSVLTSEYKDVNRTYNDVAQTLANYPSLSPRTDVYTYENGASALLLHVSGTLPVTFRGTTYRFPIALWVPQGYPLEAPLAYVIPTETMMVRPGQHVDPQGKVYHPYLVGWAEFWDKSNIVDFLAILRDVFAKEPPVISRQSQNPPRPEPTAAPPPLPPLPPGVGRASPILTHKAVQPQPPPPPPKTSTNTNTQSHQSETSRWGQSGPPLPPLPPQTSSVATRYVQPIQQPQLRQSNTLQRHSSSPYESAPPVNTQVRRQQTLQAAPSSPVSPMTPPQEPYRRDSSSQPHQPPQQNSAPAPPGPNQQYRGQMPPSYQPQQTYAQPPQPQWQTHPPQGVGQPQPHQQPRRPPQPKAPQPSLLDTPLTLSLPTSSNLPAPPIPPNPEKDLLLHNIARTLHTQRQHIVTQASSSLPGLSAQRSAMLTALANMQAEKAALENLQALLSSNTTILHTALRDADSVIESSQHRKAPAVDELLVAPTVVGNQLYDLVSEERSLGDALFVLGRAVERGRVSPMVFARMTRSLAREWYFKKALVKKIGRGMGLATY